MSSAVPSLPSGPGWFCARVSTMNRWPGGTSSPLPAIPSGPRVTSGSSSLRGTKTVPPLLTVWSTPWSKNWPKNVNSELYGGERPTSVVTFGMNSVLCSGTQSGGGSAVGAPQTNTPVLFCVRTGNPAAATAAGLVEVWSTMRLLIVRGCESTTSPLVEYAVRPLPSVLREPGWSGTGKELAGSASRNFGVVSRGNCWSAAPKLARCGNRSLQDPSTVRRPYGVSRSGIWYFAGPTSVLHGSAEVSVAACRSEILICLRMNDRSPAVTVKPDPTGPATAADDEDCDIAGARKL